MGLIRLGKPAQIAGATVMTLRDNCNQEELEAHRILDMAKAGFDVPDSAVVWALLTLGDGVNQGLRRA